MKRVTPAAGLFLVGVIVACCGARPSRAATLYWDADGTGASGNPPSGPPPVNAPAPAGFNDNPDGTGTWNSSNLNWWNGTGYQTWTASGGEDIADFRAGPANGNGGVITISGTVNVNRMVFSTSNNWVFSGGTINLTGVATLQRVNGNQFFNADITGSNGVTLTGGGIQVFDVTQKHYSGNTTISNILRLAQAASALTNLLPTTTTVTLIGGATIDARTASQQITGLESLSGAGLYTRGAGASAHTLTLSRASGTSTYGGVFSVGITNGSINLVKSGGYTQIFSGAAANVFSNGTGVGTVNVQAGVLALAKTAGVDALGTGTITITGGSLRLDASDQINNSAPIVLAGGRFDLNGKNETVGAGSLTASSTIDFGSTVAANTLNLSSLSFTAGTLTIDNWDGTWGGGGGNDQLRVTNSPSTAILNAIHFTPTAAHPDGFMNGALAINHGTFFEIVAPVPEPASTAVVAAMSLSLATRRRRGGV